MSTITLSFMGECEPETFRCRVYGSEGEYRESDPDEVREPVTTCCGGYHYNGPGACFLCPGSCTHEGGAK